MFLLVSQVLQFYLVKWDELGLVVTEILNLGQWEKNAKLIKVGRSRKVLDNQCFACHLAILAAKIGFESAETKPSKVHQKSEESYWY